MPSAIEKEREMGLHIIDVPMGLSLKSPVLEDCSTFQTSSSTLKPRTICQIYTARRVGHGPKRQSAIMVLTILPCSSTNYESWLKAGLAIGKYHATYSDHNFWRTKAHHFQVIRANGRISNLFSCQMRISIPYGLARHTTLTSWRCRKKRWTRARSYITTSTARPPTSTSTQLEP